MKRFLLVAFSFVTLMMSWEGQLTTANVLDNGPIPQESIRLRIIANSDSIQDQWLKREVRDAIIEQMNVWVKDIRSYEDAKVVVANKLPELQAVVDTTMRERGFSYDAEVDFGRVPFPTKLYGSYVYPAGEYEALRVRIGKAEGQNWWCVLFPPLCFIDMSNGDAATAKAAEPRTKAVSPAEKEEEGTSAVKWTGKTRDEWQEWRQFRFVEKERLADEKADASFADTKKAAETAKPVVAKETTEVEDTPEETPQVQVRFFIWEKLDKWFS
ncbi:stage II sporulation protein R [Brevibacillus ruminantium]|uniref:Stage II sporulation protein R n=1 Tax=Brevibacillus ruminantium TaxID=2950604 RepID=A0ABY4WE41_9BACL|nr:stage II sporulation protein R [Brevibacillus ruminantium]USG65430.1 stage II sporulation protein R [Brevibacillus ruminantium]